MLNVILLSEYHSNFLQLVLRTLTARALPPNQLLIYLSQRGVIIKLISSELSWLFFILTTTFVRHNHWMPLCTSFSVYVLTTNALRYSYSPYTPLSVRLSIVSSQKITMSSWLSVVLATVTCLLLSPITCLPVRDVADGTERREVVHNTWLEPADVMPEESSSKLGNSATSLLLQKSAGSDSMLGLLLALRDTHAPTNARDHYTVDAPGNNLHKRQSKVDDYGHGMFWGKRGSTWLQHDEVKTAKQTKRAHDEYGFGLFFGKRDDADYDDFTL